MDTKSRALLSGGAALGISLAILGASILSGVPVLSNLVRTVGPGTPGTLTVMITDPPHVPEGVTAVYVTYSNLAVHVSEADNLSGWTRVSSGGTIDLLTTVNISETIAAVSVPYGEYNALALNVTSAEVTYEGDNYTAFVVNAKLFIPIIGGIEVSDSKPSATIIDISPLVINIGSSSTPEFVIRTAAVAFPVPSSEVTEEMEHEGFRFGLAGRLWWHHYYQSATANLVVTDAVLSSDSLNVTVKSGSTDTTIKLVIVSPLARALDGEFETRVPPMLWGTAVFVVENNGTLVPLHQFIRTVLAGSLEPRYEIREAFKSAGYTMTSGSTTTFTYTGQISLGFSFEGLLTRQVVLGQQYRVTVIGIDALASQVVVAT